MLLLVDHQKSQRLELHALGEQRVRPDHDLDRPVREPRPRLRRLLRRNEPRKLPQPQRQPAEPLGEILEMLPRQQRRRCDHRHLHPRHRRDIGRAQRHLGLAEADVAADQPVHRPPRFHVAEHVGDRVQLVLGLRIGEPRAELLPGVMVRRRQDSPPPQLPLRGDPDQPVRHIADPRLQPRLLRLPRPAAQPVEQPLLMPVARQELDILHRQVELVAAGIFQAQALVRRPHRGDGLEPEIAPDAVIDMHHQIARRQPRRLGEKILRALPPPGGTDQPVAEHVLLGDHRQPRRLEAVLQRPDRQRQPAAALDLPRPRNLPRVGHAAVGEQPRQPLPRPLGVAGDHHLAALAPRRHMRRQRAEEAHRFLLPLRREVAPDPPAGVDHPRPQRLRQHAQLVERPPGHRRLPARLVEIELARGHRLIDRPELRLRRQRHRPRVILLGERRPARRPRRPGLVVEQHRRPGQIVEQGLQPRVEERQPMLVALVLPPGADRLVERIVAPRRPEHRPVAGAEPLDRRLVEDHLADRRQLHPLHRLGGALGLGIEPPRALQHVAEHVEPHRPARAGRIEVDQTAADRELARLGDGRRLLEAHPRQIPPELRHIDPPADLRGEARRRQHRARRHPLRRGIERGQHRRRPVEARRQRRQRRHPRRGDLGIGRDAIVGQAVPGRKPQHRQLRREEPQRRAQRRQPRVVPRHMDHRPAGPRHRLGEIARVESLWAAADEQPSGNQGPELGHPPRPSASRLALQAPARPRRNPADPPPVFCPICPSTNRAAPAPRHAGGAPSARRRARCRAHRGGRAPITSVGPGRTPLALRKLAPGDRPGKAPQEPRPIGPASHLPAVKAAAAAPDAAPPLAPRRPASRRWRRTGAPAAAGPAPAPAPARRCRAAAPPAPA